MEDILINLGVSAVLTSVKNKAKRTALKKVLFKVCAVIYAAFASDGEETAQELDAAIDAEIAKSKAA